MSEAKNTVVATDPYSPSTDNDNFHEEGPLKVTDACTACFEQRTVFTQQVFEKSLNKLVDKVPIPLLFMRTVIQALDTFPALVDFVMGILSRLVNKQVSYASWFV
ncbi:hypothetical protein GUJ93_ZPchr0007g4083 [Zizania palustris]|uniref:Symplekin C-terminal domain-containing protein n=1 Tax=Zizania palustris TaxID=103762 RepID=A0A8J5W449_ZIZPA|nr:hypothetical protein GUJ93_ZPchr0007g4083 [Zizania palustris]